VELFPIVVIDGIVTHRCLHYQTKDKIITERDNFWGVMQFAYYELQ
jgi:hypothetical protein